MFSGCGESPEKTLYSFWQIQNAPEPGRYEDELVSAKVLLECKAANKYPAYFGYLTIRTTFAMFAIKNPKPFKVYVGGIKFGDRTQVWIQPEESGGEGIIGRLELNGCTIPPQLEQRPSPVPAGTQRSESATPQATKTVPASASGLENIAPNLPSMTNRVASYLEPYQGAYNTQCTGPARVMVKGDAISIIQDGKASQLSDLDVIVSCFGNAPPEGFNFAVQGKDVTTGANVTLLAWDGKRGKEVSVGESDAPRLSRCP